MVLTMSVSCGHEECRMQVDIKDEMLSYEACHSAFIQLSGSAHMIPYSAISNMMTNGWLRMTNYLLYYYYKYY
jgi:hypothetical protein